MDPSQIQSDSENDVNSLDTGDAGTESVSVQQAPAQPPANTMGPDSSSLETPPPEMGGPVSTPGSNGDKQGDKKPFFLKRLWQKLNIYLLLFILVLLIAGGAVIVLTVKSRTATVTTTTNSQSLSDSTLKQLANSDASVGSPKQTLNVESNAVFAGTVLVRQDLEVAGTIHVNGALALPGITVSGSSTFNQIQANTVGISGSETVQGTLTAKSGISVTGNSNFSGNVSATQVTTGVLQLNGDLALTHHIIAGGPIPTVSQGTALGSGGTTSLSGSDTTGVVTINTGSGPAAGCFANITFAKAFSGTPHVVITPVGASGAGIAYYVNRTTAGFSICTVSPATGNSTFAFDYVALD